MAGRSWGILTIFQPKASILRTLDEWEFLIAPLLFTIISFFTRMYKIGLSNIVTWDEAQYATPLMAYNIATFSRDGPTDSRHCI